ncbi:hypothetical protein [Pseudomonas sp. RIT-PI-S]|uniref:hypothetical protein n=1 Tax=Pseudomonas sp. RIT-PI-S TaxID=3035295 RepID=UPI0021DB1E6B|nr:hypothetical protein [Pseudomonas sp. RIT-PI-S]
MTRFALPAIAFCASALLAAPTFAAGDLCSANLQKIHDTLATTAQTNPALDKTMRGEITLAENDHKAGKEKDCVARTGKIITQLDNYTKKGGAAGN